MHEIMEFIELAQTGQVQAEEDLLRRYEKLIHKYAWHNGQYSEDCRQTTIAMIGKWENDTSARPTSLYWG